MMFVMSLRSFLLGQTVTDDPPEQHRSLEDVMFTRPAWEAMTGWGIYDPISVPSIYAATTLIADSVGQLTPVAYRKQGNRILGKADPQPSLLIDPCPRYTMMEWASTIAYSLARFGNAYLHLQDLDRDGHPRTARPIPNDEMVINWNSNADPFIDRTYPVYEWRGRPMTPGIDLAHIRLTHLPGELEAKSPLDAAVSMVKGALAADEFGSQFWESGAVPSGIIKTPQELSRDEAQKVKEQFVAGQKVRTPAVLHGGWDYDAIDVSMADAQFIESRQFYVLEVARIYKIPAPLLNAALSGSASIVYQNERALIRGFIRHALGPYLSRIEEAMSRMIPRPLYVRFDTSEFLRGDVEVRFNAFAIALDHGFMTIDEVREAEALDPMDGEIANVGESE